MTFISWNDTYNTDTEKIDEQHRKLVDIINELYDAKETGKAQEALDGILSRLMDYTKYHFDFEEALLDELDYPELVEHKAKHQELIDQIGMILKSHLDNKRHVDTALLMFLKHWLVKHIMNEDMKALSFRG
jgi:hemerythrin